ncbi:MAG: AAA family ATPase [Candidatus Kerfeldbacteria bacterium]|jgi:dephospho-CoA kinase
MNNKQKIVALVGMSGAGKSEVADKFVEAGYEYLRFGQITLDEVKKRGLEPKEENERPIREAFRKEHGMAAFAILNMPKMDKILSNGKNVLADGLYSWSEYKVLKDKYKDNLIVVAVYAPPEVRYARLEDRRSKYKDDPNMKYRSFSNSEAKSRDYSEIENIEKAGPIAMANYTIVNTLTLESLHKCIEYIINEINNGKK